MKTITDYANDYVGHPQEIDEALSTYSKREAFKAGMKKAFELIYDEVYYSLQYTFKAANTINNTLEREEENE